METTCCFCGQKIDERYANNPWPVRKDGVCCDDCNVDLVVYARLRMYKNQPWRRLYTCVEIYDKENDMVWGEYDNEKDAKSDMKIWHLDGYELRWVACEVVNETYFAFAYAQTKKELKKKIEEHNKQLVW